LNDLFFVDGPIVLDLINFLVGFFVKVVELILNDCLLLDSLGLTLISFLLLPCSEVSKLSSSESSSSLIVSNFFLGVDPFFTSLIAYLFYRDIFILTLDFPDLR